MKAQFNITLIHPKNFVALSNTFPKGEQICPGSRHHGAGVQGRGCTITLLSPMTYDPCIGDSVQLDGEPDWLVTEFHTTPKMSTYLLAYIVSEFKSVETLSPNNIVVGSCALASWAHTGPGWRDVPISPPLCWLLNC